MRKRGRPKRVPLVDPVVADEVCEWIAEGRTMSSYCRQPGKLSVPTINRWRDRDPDFASRVARAKDCGFDRLADECLEIADNTQAGQIVTEDKDGRKVVTEDMLGHRKLRIETRLKLLACWDPRRYGNKADVTVTDPGAASAAARLWATAAASMPATGMVLRGDEHPEPKAPDAG